MKRHYSVQFQHGSFNVLFVRGTQTPTKLLNYRLSTKLREVNVFTVACLSTGGVSIPGPKSLLGGWDPGVSTWNEYSGGTQGNGYASY